MFTKETLLSKETNCVMYLDKERQIEFFTSMRDSFIREFGFSDPNAQAFQAALEHVRGD